MALSKGCGRIYGAKAALMGNMAGAFGGIGMVCLRWLLICYAYFRILKGLDDHDDSRKIAAGGTGNSKWSI